MKRLHFVKPNDLSRLHDQLLAGIPSLAPIRDARGVGKPVMTVEGLGDDIWLTVPDTEDEPTIAAIIQAHDPSAEGPPTPTEARAQRISELLTIPRSDWTVAQQRELLQLVAQET
jgi:hypothetical protein